ncbi:hypothetical protein ONZ43_g5458 [Nemania bipapillata]|uniref:Uncharacterized protein n=1 Tax=Nemania bipapillata TaxID=110536 RepID=A0ACC2IAF6_9PEZI|nr:hypothetical protein ONZ43_g5458 [Nemania bipapillata]
MHFLRRAIEGHASGVDETANVLTTLLRPTNTPVSNDPYRHWFAAAILFHLVFENPEGKTLAMSVTEGDAESGEEVVTSIQTITAHLVTALSRGDDDRVAVGYLMLLTGWLFEDMDGVNDFLGEGSNIHALSQEIVRHPPGSVLIQGLCAMILGVIYEFSTKDSPIPRSTLHSVIMSRVGREKYVDALNKLRSHTLMRDFEVTPQKADGSGNLPDVYFDATFVEFFKDNYSRIARAIDRDPGLEISVVTNGVQKGISRELVDSLRSQLEEKEQALQAALTNVASLNGKLGQEQADHRRSKEGSIAELARIKNINEAMQRHHEGELNRLEVDLMKANKAKTQAIEATREELNSKLSAEELKSKSAEKRATDLEKQVLTKQAEAEEIRTRLKEKEEQHTSTQTELDDLLMVFGDLEDKIEKYKKRLKGLGEVISDGEGEDDDDDTEDGEED